MKAYWSIFKIEETNTVNQQIRFILLNLFVFFLPFERFYTTLLIYPIILLTLIDFKHLNYKQITLKTLLFQAVWLLSLLGYFYSQEKGVASFMLEKQLMLFVFPIILPLAFEINANSIKKLLISLVIGSITALIILFAYLFMDFFSNKNFTLTNHFNHNFSAPISVHPTYLSLIVNLSIISLLYGYKETKNKIASIVLILILLVGIVFLSSKNITISTVIVVATLTYSLFKNKRYYVVSLLLVGALFVGMIASNDYLKDRFTTQLFQDISNSDKKQIHLLEPRSERWKLGWELIKEKPLFGHGTGDEVMELKKKYAANKMFISYIESFNIHNQYLSILIKHGIIGFLVFSFALGYYVWIGIKSKNVVYLFFLGVLFLAFMTENILDSNKGIFYFAFFNTIFGYYAVKQVEEHNL
ncbi:MAG TPA: O-antigen ligase family protein [Crocinitomicaceae bacterium]|nr:O-antigen ligase family protein [Crocinitomicaceae bacterium]